MAGPAQAAARMHGHRVKECPATMDEAENRPNKGAVLEEFDNEDAAVSRECEDGAAVPVGERVRSRELRQEVGASTPALAVQSEETLECGLDSTRLGRRLERQLAAQARGSTEVVSHPLLRVLTARRGQRQDIALGGLRDFQPRYARLQRTERCATRIRGKMNGIDLAE